MLYLVSLVVASHKHPPDVCLITVFLRFRFFFSSIRPETGSCVVSWARRFGEETTYKLFVRQVVIKKKSRKLITGNIHIIELKLFDLRHWELAYGILNMK